MHGSAQWCDPLHDQVNTARRERGEKRGRARGEERREQRAERRKISTEVLHSRGSTRTRYDRYITRDGSMIVIRDYRSIYGIYEDSIVYDDHYIATYHSM